MDIHKIIQQIFKNGRYEGFLELIDRPGCKYLITEEENYHGDPSQINVYFGNSVKDFFKRILYYTKYYGNFGIEYGICDTHATIAMGWTEDDHSSRDDRAPIIRIYGITKKDRARIKKFIKTKLIKLKPEKVDYFSNYDSRSSPSANCSTDSKKLIKI